jgi:hypothetical protein
VIYYCFNIKSQNTVVHDPQVFAQHASRIKLAIEERIPIANLFIKEQEYG